MERMLIVKSEHVCILHPLLSPLLPSLYICQAQNIIPVPSPCTSSILHVVTLARLYISSAQSHVPAHHSAGAMALQHGQAQLQLLLSGCAHAIHGKVSKRAASVLSTEKSHLQPATVHFPRIAFGLPLSLGSDTFQHSALLTIARTRSTTAPTRVFPSPPSPKLSFASLGPSNLHTPGRELY